MKIPKYILDIARQSALRSNVKRAKMSALVLNSDLNGVECKSHNLRIYGAKTFTLHAEELLLAKCRYYFPTILVARAKKNGFGNSKPCKKCMKLLKSADIRTVIYYQDGWKRIKI